MLSRSEACQHDPHREKTQQHQYHRPNPARIDGFCRQPKQHCQKRQRQPHPAPGTRLQIHGSNIHSQTVNSHPALQPCCATHHTAGAETPAPANNWCTGEDSNLRSSKERQIYSLLPLTTRPPVHNFNARASPRHTQSNFKRFFHEGKLRENKNVGME
jgi:hypothetical protein